MAEWTIVFRWIVTFEYGEIYPDLILYLFHVGKFTNYLFALECGKFLPFMYVKLLHAFAASGLDCLNDPNCLVDGGPLGESDN